MCSMCNYTTQSQTNFSYHSTEMILIFMLHVLFLAVSTVQSLDVDSKPIFLGNIDKELM